MTSLAMENVWDYPRPPALQKTGKRLRVFFNSVLIADTTNAYRVLETSHPPTYYLPPSDINFNFLTPTMKRTVCEWKGEAGYYNVTVAGQTVKERAWFYSSPTPGFLPIKGYVSFYASPFECFVDDEKVATQEGDFYGGWITSDITGGERGFKGGAGTWGW